MPSSSGWHLTLGTVAVPESARLVTGSSCMPCHDVFVAREKAASATIRASELPISIEAFRTWRRNGWRYWRFSETLQVHLNKEYRLERNRLRSTDGDARNVLPAAGAITFYKFPRCFSALSSLRLSGHLKRASAHGGFYRPAGAM